MPILEARFFLGGALEKRGNPPGTVGVSEYAHDHGREVANGTIFKVVIFWFPFLSLLDDPYGILTKRHTHKKKSGRTFML